MVARCPSVTREGKPCSATPRPGSAYCAWHDPDLSKRRSEWSAKGGANRSNKARARRALPAEVMTIEEVASWLGVVYRGVIAKTIDPPIATAAANVARTMNELLRSQQIDERLTEVESVLGVDRRPA